MLRAKSVLLIFFIVFIFLTCLVRGQNGPAKVDSLLHRLGQTLHDTDKVNTLNQLSKFDGWAVGNYEKSMQYATEARSLAEKWKYKKGKADAYNSIGIVNESYGNYPDALKSYLVSLGLRQEIGDKKGIAVSYNNIGIVYYYQGNYPAALKNYFAAFKIREELGDRQEIAASYNNIGLVYESQRNYRDALKNHFASLKIKKEIGDQYGIAASYNNIGAVYEKQGNDPGVHPVERDSFFIRALESHFASLKIKKEIEDKFGVAASYNNIGTVYYYQGNYPDALENYLAALKIREEIGDKQGIAGSYNNVGSVYSAMRKAKEGRKWQENALRLSREIGQKETIQNSYAALAKADSLLGNFKSAYENYKMYIIYRDSLFNEESAKKSVQAQMQYEFDKREAVADAEHRNELASQGAIAEEKNRRQRIVTYSVLGGLVLVLVFAGFVFRALRITRKQKQVIEKQKEEVEQQKAEVEAAKHIIEEKNKDILDSIYYARRIQRSLMPTEGHVFKTLQRLTGRITNNE